MMGNPQWKRTERRIAIMLGGRRVPVSGRQRGDAPDIEHPSLSIECKHRQAIPQWLTEAVGQAEAAATAGKTPIVVIHAHGTRYDDALVVLKLSQFVERHTPIAPERR